MMQAQKRFRLTDLERATDYTVGTIEGHISKKWHWFLAVSHAGYWVKPEEFQGYTLEQFLDDLRQKRQKQVVHPPTVVVQRVFVPLGISSRTASLFVLLLAIMWWYRMSRRYRVRIWRVYVPL